MRVWIRHIWEMLTASYWFLPSLMVAAAAVMAYVLLWLDRSVIASRGDLGWLYTGGADGAKAVLSTIGGSVITAGAVVFSITIAALTQASQQFGPRLLRNFMGDRGNQVVLGTFTATFLYSLLVLRAIRGEFEGGSVFVPHASVTMAVVLAVASIAVLIYFIHHVSMALQAPQVVAAVLEDLEEVIGRLFGDEEGSGVSLPEYAIPPMSPEEAQTVHAGGSGYVQAIDHDALLRIATEADVTLKLEHRPGDYIICDGMLMNVWPKQRCDEALQRRLAKTFYWGNHRTPEQDVEYAIRQMVEVAVRALSPGVNDPFTAMNCLDALGSAVCSIARRGLPGPLRFDDGGALRITLPVSTFDGIVDASFNQIRQYGLSSVAVTIHLLEVLIDCAPLMKNDQQRQALLRQAGMTYRQSEQVILDPQDREDVRIRWEKAYALLADVR